MTSTRRHAGLTIAVAAGVGITLVSAGTAAAVSGGGYKTKNQGCRPSADANTYQGAQRGCHNFNLLIGDGRGHYYVQVGVNQEPQRQNPHAGDVTVSPTGGARPDGTYRGTGGTVNWDSNWQPIPPNQCGAEDIALYGLEYGLYLAGQSHKPCSLDPTKWRAPAKPPSVSENVTPGSPNAGIVGLVTDFSVYLGADDNLDSGEHDGVNGQYGSGGAANGPSDGGALLFNWHPTAVPAWASMVAHALQAQNLAPVAENPVPVADAGGGMCADGICMSVETRQRTIYQGGSKTKKSRDVYNYQGKTWSPYDCSSGDPKSEQACLTEGHHSMTWYRNHEARNVYAEPGIQLYEDPDPQGSPVLPIQFYPLPALYVGTCGVVAGGGGVQAPASPLTNSAGQLVVNPTGC